MVSFSTAIRSLARLRTQELRLRKRNLSFINSVDLAIYLPSSDRRNYHRNIALTQKINLKSNSEPVKVNGDVSIHPSEIELALQCIMDRIWLI